MLKKWWRITINVFSNEQILNLDDIATTYSIFKQTTDMIYKRVIQWITFNELHTKPLTTFYKDDNIYLFLYMLLQDIVKMNQLQNLIHDALIATDHVQSCAIIRRKDCSLRASSVGFNVSLTCQLNLTHIYLLLYSNFDNSDS